MMGMEKEIFWGVGEVSVQPPGVIYEIKTVINLK